MIRTSDQKENVLYVDTFGGFSLTWNGRRIGSGPKERDSQTVRLLEAVIHSGEKGFRRAQLEEIAKMKEPDLNAADLDAAVSMIAGTARSMGVVVED